MQAYALDEWHYSQMPLHWLLAARTIGLSPPRHSGPQRRLRFTPAGFERAALGQLLRAACPDSDLVVRNLVALALSQRLAILPLGAPESSDVNSIPQDACAFPEQITSLYWVGYAGTPVAFYRMSKRSASSVAFGCCSWQV